MDEDTDDDHEAEDEEDEEQEYKYFFEQLLGKDYDEDDYDNYYDDDEMFFLTNAIMATMLIRQRQQQLCDQQQQRQSSRKTFYVRDRLEWDRHVQELAEEGPHAFPRLYRMEESSFAKLCQLIGPFVCVDAEMSRRASQGKEPISVEIMVHCMLRWLGGGSYLDIRLSAGISIPSFYRCAYACIDAILLCDSLAFSFPTSPEDLQTAANGFKNISSNGVIEGCVACLDGMLLRIQTPSPNEVGNVKSFFSGHYQVYGINVQAACDSNCRFVSACVSSPGGTNDIAAFRKTPLAELIANRMPVGKYIIGDNAYTCCEHLLTPFAGEQKRDPLKDAYNFYLSQLRIRIEMTFGMLTTKWRIFRRPLQVSVANAGKIFLACARLHNFIINLEGGVPSTVGQQGGVATTEIGMDDDDENNDDVRGFLPSDIGMTAIPGNSMMRDILMERISAMALVRPRYNIERNNNSSRTRNEED